MHRNLVAGRQSRLSLPEMPGGATHLGQQRIEMRAAGVRRRLTPGLIEKLLELIGIDVRLLLRVDMRQMAVDFGTKTDELPDEGLLDLILIGRRSVAASRDPAGEKNEHRAHCPHSPHGSSFRFRNR
ncbi:hypothetical protein OWR29_46300 [Actinoplanes sp. Pm04-4]|uniref:Uncharacterized protein n=1 Tax=Paractinoplanes pyxinae TaxID=2997416 RepID=A0ABT4BG11_9ACTN|nr:hypothetical protein [Actinoplanes pyxinae]MCY1145461.1 hypothetical protein [Actinoplanes pyxinae]